MREYLLFKRVARFELGLPEFWQGITGGMESGESIEDAAIREVKEESGIEVYQLTDSSYSYDFPIKEEWKLKYTTNAESIIEHVFYAEVEEFPVLSCEHQEFGWFSFNQAMCILSFGNNKKALSYVEASLNA